MTNENPSTLTTEDASVETPETPEAPKVVESTKVYDLTKPLYAVFIPLIIALIIWMSADEVQSILTQPLSRPRVIWDLSWIILAAGFIVSCVSEACRVFMENKTVAKWTKFASRIFYFGAAFVAATSLITVLPVLSGIIYVIAGIGLVLYVVSECFGKQWLVIDRDEDDEEDEDDDDDDCDFDCDCDCHREHECDCDEDERLERSTKTTTTEITWTFGRNKDK